MNRIKHIANTLLTGYALLNCSTATAVDRICNPLSEGGSVNCPVIDGDIIKASSLFPNSGHVHGQYISSATPSLNASGNSVTLNGVKTSGASVGLIGGGVQLKTSQGNIPLVGINLNNNKLILNNGSLVHSFVYGSMLSANAAINFTGDNDPIINMNGNSIYINSGASVGTGNLSDVSSAYAALQGPVNLESNVTLNAEDNKTVIDGGFVAKGNVQALRGIINNVTSAGYLKLNGNNNTVVVKNNANIFGSVYGTHGVLGHSTTQSGGDGLVSENLKVTLNVDNTNIDISDSKVGGDVVGNYGDINSIKESQTLNASFTNSIINIDSSVVSGGVYGGIFSPGGTEYNNSNVKIDSNIITIKDSGNNLSIGNDNDSGVYGAYIDLTKVNTINKSSYHATNNVINIDGKVNDNAINKLYGGFINGSTLLTDSVIDSFTGNTLNFSASSIKVKEIGNFENYNFTLIPSMVNDFNTSLITADTITFGTNDTNMKGGDTNTSKIKVVGIKSGDELRANDKFVLMRATDSMSGEAKGLPTKGVAQQGISLLYDVETNVDLDGKLVTATIIGKEKPVDPVEPPVDPEKPVVPPVEPGKPAAWVNPQLKSLSEGHLAAAMMITRGADTLAYDTINTIKQQNQEKGWAPFINLSGDKTRYNSGSHINAKDALLTGGVSYQADKLTSAVLIESGWGSYDTHNSFNTMNSVKGDGHSRYLGLGVLGRYDFESGVYADASLRGGKNRNTFDTKDIQNLTTGERVHYNLDSNYVSAHVGTGYTKALDEKNTLDVSAKYLWTQLKGKDVKIAGDNIHFDDINSHRVRLNAGVAHQSTKAVQLRAGLGYEYEFDGKAKASTYGYDIAAPSVQGSTVIMTVGTTVTPMANQAFSIDMNANGYTGQRDGIGGNIKFSYAF